MIADEKAKQESLNNEISIDKNKTSEAYSNYATALNVASNDYKKTKNALALDNSSKQEALDSYYNNEINKANKDIDSLNDAKNSLENSNLKIKEAYDVLDNSLSEKRIALKELFNTKLNEINTHYEMLVEERKKQNSQSNILNDEVVDCFKKTK